MIDAESDVFGIVATKLRDTYDGIFVSGEYVDTPARFPAVSLFEADSSVYQRVRTTNIENAEKVMWEVNVYSNKTGYKKMEAKKIMDTVDTELAQLGFTRTMMTPASNLQDATIYRIVARYEAVIDKDLWIYTS